MNTTGLKELLEEFLLRMRELFTSTGAQSQLRTEKVYVRVKKPFER